MTSFVYFSGSVSGRLIKIGYTSAMPWGRARETRLGHEKPIALAAVRARRGDERALHDYWKRLRYGDEAEVFAADDELVGWINWLRQQWFTWADTEVADGPDDVPDFRDWRPIPGERTLTLGPPDPGALLQHYDVTSGPFRDTRWAAMAIPPPDFNDYYTPPWLVELARQAMGGLDLDPASHWTANRVHRAGTFYHKYRSAFERPWFGRVWLNPPYGENQKWFEPILRYWGARGGIEQLCMLSPVWAFNTRIAAPVVEHAAAFLLLSPAPKFWGQDRRGVIRGPDQAEFGSDHPHAILYLGHRPGPFREAFADRGIFMRLDPATAGLYRPGAREVAELEGAER